MLHSTVVLGIGSNLGQPLQHLRTALKYLAENFKVLNVSSIYESDALMLENSPLDWNKKFLNAAVSIQVTDSLNPEELLKTIKSIELKMGRISTERWSPRIIDIDILYWDELKYESEALSVPHTMLLERPFALLPLLEIRPELRCRLALPLWAQDWSENKPLNTRLSRDYFWSRFMGVINLTPDSFSDGGLYLDETALVAKITEFIRQGADIIDFGAESTRPSAFPADEEVEFKNLEFGFNILRQLNYSGQVSLDCRRANVAARVLEKFNIDYLNDVEGLQSKSMQKLALEQNLKAIVMHSLSIPPKSDLVLNQGQSPVVQINEWWKRKKDSLLQIGLKAENLILDCGICFGKTKQQNISLIKNANLIEADGCEVLLGHSRKSYQTLFSDREASLRDLETAIVTSRLNLSNIHYLRVHDVATQKAALAAKGYF